MAITFDQDDFGCYILKEFAKFALTKASRNQATEMKGRDIYSPVGKATVTASWRARSKKSPSAKATEAAKRNNAVRDALVAGLLREFEKTNFGDLPPGVKKALKGTYAKTAEGDFGFVEGESTSGKPLTKRRITAVLKAVKKTKEELAKPKVKNMVIEGKKKANHGAYFGDCATLLDPNSDLYTY